MPADVVHTDISDVSIAFAVLGVFIVVYGLFSYSAKERLYLSESLIAVLFGIVTGPYVIGWVDPLSWGESAETTNYTTYQFTRLVVGVQVLFTGISLPKAYLRREALSLTVLLFAVMTLAWVVTAALIYALFQPLTYLEALCVSAAITPTDPVLANSITKGRYAEKHVPVNVRNIIVAESGANDGLGFPFLYLAIYLLRRTGEDAGQSVGNEIGRWLYAVVIYQILVSCCYGAVVGYIARKSLKWAETRGYIDKDNFFAYGLGLALFVLGTTGLFGSDDILACFIAGNSFTWDDYFRVRTEEQEEDSFQNIIDMLFSAAVFIYIGAIIPWADYSTGNTELGIDPWRVVVLGITVLLVRRPPWVLALSKIIPALTTHGEAAFAGWFGPIGVGAVFYIQVALRELPEDGSRDRLRALYTPVVLFCVFASVLTHGSTIPISKLGPHIVRRTATLTQTRSINFTSRPSSRQPSIHEASAGSDASAKEPLNPLWEVYQGCKSVGLFWRKDSWWRREPSSVPKHIRATDIGVPTRAEKQREIEDSLHSESGGNSSPPIAGGILVNKDETSSRGGRTPPVALELPTTAPHSGAASVASRPATGTAAEGVALPDKAAELQGSDGFFANLRAGLQREIAAERKEAMDEAEAGWPAEVRETMTQQQAQREGKSTPPPMTPNKGFKDALRGGDASGSAPGTPGGSRVRFGEQ